MSRGSPRNTSAAAKALAASDRWECMTPCGTPVVPEDSRITAQASGSHRRANRSTRSQTAAGVAQSRRQPSPPSPADATGPPGVTSIVILPATSRGVRGPLAPEKTTPIGASQSRWARCSSRDASACSGMWTTPASRQARSTRIQSGECGPTWARRSPQSRPAATKASASPTAAAMTSPHVHAHAWCPWPAAAATARPSTIARRSKASPARAARRSTSDAAAWPTRGREASSLVVAAGFIGQPARRGPRFPDQGRCTSSPGRSGRRRRGGRGGASWRSSHRWRRADGRWRASRHGR